MNIHEFEYVYVAKLIYIFIQSSNKIQKTKHDQDDIA